ncbi:hypothetical protein JHW43_008512 [Diplocarpon mali]|nr:hypothetical protein JHW43_008512 [Diplocarpon mali]
MTVSKRFNAAATEADEATSEADAVTVTGAGVAAAVMDTVDEAVVVGGPIVEPVTRKPGVAPWRQREMWHRFRVIIVAEACLISGLLFSVLTLLAGLADGPDPAGSVDETHGVGFSKGHSSIDKLLQTSLSMALDVRSACDGREVSRAGSNTTLHRRVAVTATYATDWLDGASLGARRRSADGQLGSWGLAAGSHVRGRARPDASRRGWTRARDAPASQAASDLGPGGYARHPVVAWFVGVPPDPRGAARANRPRPDPGMEIARISLAPRRSAGAPGEGRTRCRFHCPIRSGDRGRNLGGGRRAGRWMLRAAGNIPKCRGSRMADSPPPGPTLAPGPNQPVPQTSSAYSGATGGPGGGDSPSADRAVSEHRTRRTAWGHPRTTLRCRGAAVSRQNTQGAQSQRRRRKSAFSP